MAAGVPISGENQGKRGWKTATILGRVATKEEERGVGFVSARGGINPFDF